MQRFLRRWRARLSTAWQSDAAFIESAYLEILGRAADQDGLSHYLRVMRDGLGRTAVLLSLMRSDEFTRTLAPVAPSMTSLRGLRPDRYRTATDRSNGQPIAIFDAASAADFDWLEAVILEHGYYEKPGVWNLGIDTDKRVIAGIIAAFAPRRAIELGCAAGAVLECLEEHGVEAEGIEISAMAIARASTGVRARIHHGDILGLDLPAAYDLLFGLDVFEHLNPNRLDAYLARLSAVTTSDAFLFCNIPAFGDDPVFGTVFPFYVDGWEADAAAGQPFTALHVDDLGFPIHGHLTWADSRWWAARFQAHGFDRDTGIERALHAKYDDYLRKRSPARRAFYVFAKPGAAARRGTVLEAIASSGARAFAL